MEALRLMENIYIMVGQTDGFFQLRTDQRLGLVHLSLRHT